MPLAELLPHTELSIAYPHLSAGDPTMGYRDAIARRGVSGEGGGSASASGFDYVNLNTGYQGPVGDMPEMRSTALHESQHMVQGREGFASGGNSSTVPPPKMPDSLKRELAAMKEQWRSLPGGSPERAALVNRGIRMEEPYTPYGTYRRLAGEAEARNVERRMDMTPEERKATPPWYTLDVPEEELIVRHDRFGNPLMVSRHGGGGKPRAAASGAMTDALTKPRAAFKKWFGKSQLVDDAGEPLVVYHGTADDVRYFNLDHPNRKDTGWLGRGAYLTTDPDLAMAYSKLKAGSEAPNIMPLYAKLENPYHATLKDKQRIQLISHSQGKEAGTAAAEKWTRELQAKGHDGVILQYEAKDVGAANASREIVVFDPKGVKSASGNRGTYSPATDDITAMISSDPRQTNEMMPPEVARV